MTRRLRHQLQVHGRAPVSLGRSVGRLFAPHRKVGDRRISNCSRRRYDLLRVLVRRRQVLTHRFMLRSVETELTDAQYCASRFRQTPAEDETDPERPTSCMTETGVGYWYARRMNGSRVPGRCRA